MDFLFSVQLGVCGACYFYSLPTDVREILL